MNRYFIFFLVSQLLSAPCYSQISQQKLEAAFIYKFISFITWPNPITEEFKVCVAGDDKLKDQLDQTFLGRSIKGVNTTVKTVYADSLDSDCSMLITGKAVSPNSINVSDNSLHISKNEALFTRSMILLKIVNDKVRFDINYKYSVEKKFKIHTKLIRIADTVLE